MSTENLNEVNAAGTETGSAEQAPRVVAVSKNAGVLDVTSLVLVAVLIAAGFILNLTVGKAISAIGIGPEFIISSFCLAILLLKPNAVQSLVIGLIAATVIQLTTTVPGADFVAEGAASLVMFAFTRSTLADKPVMPAIGSFVTTLISGLIFAAIAIPAKGATIELFYVMLPVIVGTAFFNAIVVQVLAAPLKKVLGR